MRLAVLAPLAVSSLALGSVTFLAAPAQSAPNPSCGLSKTEDPSRFTVSGKNFKPNEDVLFKAGAAPAGTTTTDAKGSFTAQINGPEGTVKAVQIDGGPTVTCGTVAETEEQNETDAYLEGRKKGYAEGKKCEDAQEPPQDFGPRDPGWREGFDDGKAEAEKKFCKKR
ncbi:hypothetical protein C4B68_00895 [Streptomyces dengpaensis]|uniref:Uncharacterized protein n=2 Tax=Streptomyces TaxID=1883 RepID=A0ABM6SJE6_9ACTN|nr:hypothetical protein C4B68_00895 [Streptomyces dengpaensis]PIA98558.1 hypothetical protein B1C81_39530 [Streptomyces sp. HG99]